MAAIHAPRKWLHADMTGKDFRLTSVQSSGHDSRRTSRDTRHWFSPQHRTRSFRL